MRELENDRAEGIQWGVEVPKPEDRFIPIVSPRAGQRCRFLCLDAELTSLNVHFHDGRTVPCSFHTGMCVLCERMVGRRWRGYVGCALWENGRLVIAEVTTWAAQHCEALRDRKTSLRGSRLTTSRAPGSRCGKVTATVEGVNVEEDRVPVPFDTRFALLRIFNAALSVVEMDALWAQQLEEGACEGGR